MYMFIETIHMCVYTESRGNCNYTLYLITTFKNVY